MPKLTWRRIDAPGGGLQAYYRAKWWLSTCRVKAPTKLELKGTGVSCSWGWEVHRLVSGEWRLEYYGYTKRQRDAKHLAACALEMMEGER